MCQNNAMHCPFPFEYDEVSSFPMGLCVLVFLLLYRNWQAMFNNVQYFTFQLAAHSVYVAKSLFRIGPIYLPTHTD